MRINAHQRECVEMSLHWALVCVLSLLEMHRTEFVPVLFHLFSRKKTFYKGAARLFLRPPLSLCACLPVCPIDSPISPFPTTGPSAANYWNQAQHGGAAEARLTYIHTFARSDGFGKLIAALQARQTPWLSAEGVRTLIAAANEARLYPPSPQQLQGEGAAAQYHQHVAGAAEELCRAFVAPLQGLTEEELKKESQDSSMQGMSSLVAAVRRVVDSHDGPPVPPTAAAAAAMEAGGESGEPEAAMGFWLALVLSHIRSSSLPLRLWAWEQMTEVVDTARLHRPPARCVCRRERRRLCVCGV